jgi:hypothetical protein
MAFATNAVAESEIWLEPPTEPEGIVATTFDAEGRDIGRSFFAVESEDGGTHRMKIELAVTGGGMNRSEAMLTSVRDSATGDARWRLTRQVSQATRNDGVALDRLVIDHVAGRASCYASKKGKSVGESGGEDGGRHVELAAKDRVVNVPLQLLFRPLAKGEVDRIRFDLALCRSQPVIQSMVAVRGPRTREGKQEIIEVRYGPDFGDTVAFFASRLLPRFSFWFEPNEGSYLGHRMPLYRKGPNVLLMRTGMEPPDLGIAMR